MSYIFFILFLLVFYFTLKSYNIIKNLEVKFKIKLPRRAIDERYSNTGIKKIILESDNELLKKDLKQYLLYNKIASIFLILAVLFTIVNMFC